MSLPNPKQTKTMNKQTKSNRRDEPRFVGTNYEMPIGAQMECQWSARRLKLEVRVRS